MRSSTATDSAVRIGWLYGFGQQAHAVADADVLGARRDRAVEHLGVRAVRVLLEEVVLDGPERVEAHLVAEHRLLERVLVRLVLLVGRPRAARPGSRRTARTSSSRTPLGGVVDQGARPYSVVARAATRAERHASTSGGSGWDGWTARLRSSPARRRASEKPPRCGSPSEGASVAGLDLNAAPRWDEVAAAAPSVSFHIADVTDEDAVAAAIAEVLAAHGRLDVVVNYAGVAGGGPVHMVDARGVPAASPASTSTARSSCASTRWSPMIEQRSGSIVNIASVEGIEGTEGGSAYNASKGGVVLLTKNMAIDYGRIGIRVNCICPGFIDTPMFRSVVGNFGADRRQVSRPAQARALRPARGDRIGRAVPGVRRRVVRHRARARGRRRLHDRHAHRAPRRARAHLNGRTIPLP